MRIETRAGDQAMSEKSLTGTITLPGVDPEKWELPGEVRPAKPGEYIYSVPLRLEAIAKDGTESPAIILRRKPRKIRVTPTQADLDAAKAAGSYGIKCFCRNSIAENWEKGDLLAIINFPVGARFVVNAKAQVFCEIEKEVTE